MSDHTPLINSKRRFEKSTYTPLKLRPGDQRNGDALQRAAFVRSLNLSADEVAALQQMGGGRDQGRAVSAVAAVATSKTATRALAAAAQLAQVPAAELTPVIERLRTIRKATFDRLAGGLRELDDLYTKAQSPNDRPAAQALQPVAAAPSPAAVASLRPSPILADTLGLVTASRAPRVLEWAAANQPQRLMELEGLASPFAGAVTDLGHADMLGAIDRIHDHIHVADLVVDFINEQVRRPIEPVGLLHLERLEMTPVAVERGELLYSLPLAPHEKVTLAHKEWTTREEEFSNYIQDYLEKFSERGVAETEDIAISSETQSKHANALSMSQTPIGSGGVTITNPADAAGPGSSVDNSDSITESKSHSRTVTEQASARTIKDHKVTFTVTTVQGVEDFTARVIHNPHDDHGLLIDYFRRMRKWQSDLYRYGVRMTYDVVLPDPGRVLRDRLNLIAELDAAIGAAFNFTVHPGDITTSNWPTLRDTYGVPLPPPPADKQTLQTTKMVDYPFDINKLVHTEQLSFNVPPGYELSSLKADCNVSALGPIGDDQKFIDVLFAGTSLNINVVKAGTVKGSVNVPITNLPHVGPVALEFRLNGVDQGVIELMATVSLSAAALEDWRMRVWTVLRDSAYQQFLARRERLRDERAQLAKDIDTTDAVALRRREREQIMRTVLEWLFPDFSAASAAVEGLPRNPASLDPKQWQQVMEYGEYIKFVQTAIDWENILVFLYPYFWTSYDTRDAKIYLDHPDPIHREFLRAGAARVVLAIRPGFEADVVALLDEARPGALGAASRFQKVIDDVQAANADFAAQAQPGDGGNDEDNPRIPGKLIGTWFDYTPTAALDFKITNREIV